MAKSTIAVSEQVKLKLLELKLEEKARSIDELLRRMIIVYRKHKFLEASKRVRKRMKELGVSLEELTSE
ncbi:MAG: hypothetical protein Q6363_000425 [Candidatus Njordarchaeota archaeon]